MKLDHPKLIRLLQKAYSAEKAAAFAYIGHAKSIKNIEDKTAIQQIEKDEWEHRHEVLSIMNQYNIPISRYYEFQFYIIGKFIAFSCFFIGWFMPYFFAGRLESGNVCEYFVLMHYFNDLGIEKHDRVLYEMGVKEKEHEIFFLNVIKDSKWLPHFEKVFNWGIAESFNDINIETLEEVKGSKKYCRI